jgi:hypothetical protein
MAGGVSAPFHRPEGERLRPVAHQDAAECAEERVERDLGLSGTILNTVAAVVA